MARIVRNIVVAALAAVGLYVLAFAGHPLPPQAKGRVVVNYWEKWTGREAAQMRVIVDDFNNTVGKDKGIYVRYLSMSNVDQKTLVATSAGVPPDVAGLWDHEVPQFAAIHAVEPLDDLARAHGITKDYYWPVYWNSCSYKGSLYGMCSTPAATALLYNKEIFAEKAPELRAAGLDPTRPPETLDELDAYAKALDTYTGPTGGKRQISLAGYLPMEPGWWIQYTGLWFGGVDFDDKTGKFTLTSPENIKAFDWIRSYPKQLGKDAMTDFTSGLGNFDSPQNAFLVGTVAMEMQGPWMANYIENNKPSMNRWKFSKEVEATMPPEKRRDNYVWGATAFPSAVRGLNDVTIGAMDVLMIPRGARHKEEAFEFIAYVNRQDVMEKLCSMHCKNSPLRKVSDTFIRNHPNPYIDVFERLAASPNAHGVPSVAIWPEASDEITVAAQKVYLLQATPEQALADAQKRLQAKLDTFNAVQALRDGASASKAGLLQ